MTDQAPSKCDLWISPGTELILQILGTEGRFRSSAVGIQAGEYLIVRAPKAAGIEKKLYLGNQVTVIVLYMGSIFGFRSKILNHVITPERLVFLSYPTTFERQELRKLDRVECRIPAVAVVAGSQVKQAGIIMDISAGGCKFTMGNSADVAQNAVAMGQKITLECEIVGIEGLETLSGEIRNIQQDFRTTSLGIQFFKPDEELTRKIDAFVESVKQVLGDSCV